MSADLFPATEKTWMLEGERLEVNRHVMAVYARPLEIYLRKSSYRNMGEPTEIVHAFFADRLSKPAFFQDWNEARLRQGKRFRNWLKTSFCLFWHEWLRRERRHRGEPLGANVEPSSPVLAPADELDRGFDQEFVINLVRQALTLAEQHCGSLNWQCFVAHDCIGWTFAEVADALNIQSQCIAGGEKAPSEIAKEKARAGRNRFRRAIRELLIRDGVPLEDIDREIGSLLESTAR